MRLANQLLALFVMVLSLNAVAVELVQTVAGNGANTNFATSGTAIGITIFPSGNATIDAENNVYFSDPNRNMIFSLNTAGVLTVIAGTGMPGFSGDGGPAINAQFCKPAGLVWATIYESPDLVPYLYVADAGNHRIRRINLNTNIISTVAGTGMAGYSGNGGPATAAALNFPCAVAAQSGGMGTFFIADSENHCIRQVNFGNISTIAGNGTPGFSDVYPGQLNKPTGLSILNDNLYIADSGNHRIRKVFSIISAPSNIVTVVGNGVFGFSGDGGLRTNAQLANPHGVAAVDANHIYVADTGNHRIRMFADNNPTTDMINTYAGNGQPRPGFGGDGGLANGVGVLFSSPSGVAANTTRVCITDEGNFRVREVGTTNNMLTTIAGNGSGAYTGNGGPAMNASFRLPQGVFVDITGNVYVADTNNHCVRKIDTLGNISTVAGNGGVEFVPDNTPLHLATNTTVPWPKGIFVDNAGQIFITDSARLRRVRADGYIETIAGDIINGQNGYSGDNGPATAARLNNPAGVIGGDNCLLILDSGNNRVRKIDSGGVITTIAGNGTFGYSGDNGPATAAQISYARGFWYDLNTKNIYIADTGNHRIRRISPSGVITTVAGNGTAGFSGDGGLATAAQLNAPLGVTTTPDGTMYVTEEGNLRVRKIAPSGIITTVNGNGTAGFDGDSVMLASSARVRYASAIAASSKGIYFTDTNNNKIRLISNNLPPILNQVQVSQDPVKVNIPVTFTALAVDPENEQLTYTWNLGDGTPILTNNPVTHTFTTEGVYTGTLTVADPWQSTTGAGNVNVVAPNSGGAGVPNIANENPLTTTVVNPLNGLSISVVSSDGGVIELYVDVNAMIRDAYSVSTAFDGSLGRVSTVTGTRPVVKLNRSEIYVATSVANEIATGLLKGKARKMLVISNREVGQNLAVNDNRTSTDIVMKKLKGKFNFKSGSSSLAVEPISLEKWQAGSLRYTAVKADTVTFSGKIHLPGGLNFSQEQEVWIGIGNIVDHVTLGPKAKAKLPSDKGFIKRFSLRYPRLTNAITAGDEIAQVNFTVSQADLPATGFDTEGISVEVTGANKTPVDRQIQVGMLLSGVAYQSSVGALFKTKINKATSTPISGDLTGLSRTGK
ncbi:MAG: PKD domain-containing protein [Planctomycetota bacterium]